MLSAKDAVSSNLREDKSSLFAIVNNAGIGFGNSIASTFATNVYGCRNVCEAFIPLLNADNGRIIFISSAAGPMFVAKCNEHMKQFFTRKDIQWSEIDALMQSCHPNMTDDDYAGKGLVDNAYGLSKACLNSYMMCLSNEHPNLKINACTPGYIETDLTKSLEGSKKPPYEGTHSPVSLLFKESIGTGKFYGSDCLRSPLDRYRNPGDPEYQSD